MSTRPNNWGWAAAAGFDYRFSSIWHVSGDFRFGENKRTISSIQHACLGTTARVSPLSGPNSATWKETNWVRDFTIGRDVGVGSGNSQIEVGLRNAEIRGTTNEYMNLFTTFAGTTLLTVSAYIQKILSLAVDLAQPLLAMSRSGACGPLTIQAVWPACLLTGRPRRSPPTALPSDFRRRSVATR